MSEMNAIVAALELAGQSTQIKSTRNMSGGCIHQVVLVTLQDESKVVAKINQPEMHGIFEEEAESLRRLAATDSVLVPEPIGVHCQDSHAVFLMSYIEPGDGSINAWTQFGIELAALHQSEAGSQYGFDMDNHLGSTFQPNGWMDDWIQFNATHRLGYQLKLARDRRLLNASEELEINKLIGRLHEFIPPNPQPAILHGDLWSGNALPAKCGRIAVIDPACSIGDGWADIAMMKLFGGFPECCFDSYKNSVKDHDKLQQRFAVYQLYHMLNHVNIFGRGYATQAISLVQRLLASG